MQKFIIGTDNFGVGKVTCEIDKENSIINNLTIIGDEQIFNKLSENEDGRWNWTLYPPEFYLREIPYKLIKDQIEVTITEEILDNCDVALYIIEHNEIEGVLTIDKNGIFTFVGSTYISGKELKLELEVTLNT